MTLSFIIPSKAALSEDEEKNFIAVHSRAGTTECCSRRATTEETTANGFRRFSKNQKSSRPQKS